MLAVKYDKVNLGTSFEQTLYGQCHRCCIPSSNVIDLLHSENLFFIYGHCSHLGHMTRTL